MKCYKVSFMITATCVAGPGTSTGYITQPHVPRDTRIAEQMELTK